MCVEGFLWMSSQGVLSTDCGFSSLAGLSERIGEGITAPWRVRTKEEEALAPPARIG